MAREATLRTLSVSIKTMTIGTKQVTLSVFRQLLEEPLLDPETGNLLGVPWARLTIFGAAVSRITCT
jgi:hypothetical protein